MIEIDMKINSYGLSETIYKVGNIWIANIGKSPVQYNSYDYVYVIYEPQSRFSEEVSLHGVVRDHCQDNPMSKLLQKVLVDYGESACGLSQQYRDHWMDEYYE